MAPGDRRGERLLAVERDGVAARGRLVAAGDVRVDRGGEPGGDVVERQAEEVVGVGVERVGDPREVEALARVVARGADEDRLGSHQSVAAKVTTSRPRIRRRCRCRRRPGSQTSVWPSLVDPDRHVRVRLARQHELERVGRRERARRIGRILGDDQRAVRGVRRTGRDVTVRCRPRRRRHGHDDAREHQAVVRAAVALGSRPGRRCAGC